MRLHLESKHEIIVERSPGPVNEEATRQLQQLYIRAQSSGQTHELNNQIFRGHLDSGAITEALVTLIVVRNLPFRIVEWPEFHALCRTLNPQSSNVITTAHSQVIKKVEQTWLLHKDVVRKKLQSAISSIHLSLDIWTAPNRMLLLGVCAHFVERSQEKHGKALLALREVANHSGAEQFNILLPVLEDYGISRKLGSIVSDNASSNDTLCRAVAAYLDEKESITWEVACRRVRCTGHIINLAVQAFLFHGCKDMELLDQYEDQEENGHQSDEEKRAAFRVMGPLGKLHNIVVHTRGSTSRSKEFKALAGRMVPLDNSTRWNSWFHMLAVADEAAGAIDTYTKNHIDVLRADYLSPEDWAGLRATKAFLKPFHRATLETQGDRATIDNVLFTMDILVQYFEAAAVSGDSRTIRIC
jgi:hypothetical protein